MVPRSGDHANQVLFKKIKSEINKIDIQNKMKGKQIEWGVNCLCKTVQSVGDVQPESIKNHDCAANI